MSVFHAPSYTQPLPDRAIKLFIVGIGLGFWIAWGIALYFVVEGHPLQAAEGCAPMAGVEVFWECTNGYVNTMASAFINALIVVTLAMPIFALAAQADPAVWPLALPGLVFHLFGLPAGMFVLVRSLRRLYEQLF